MTKTNKYSILSTEILYPKTENVNIQTNGNPMDDREIKNNMIAEPILIEFSETLIPLIISGLETNAVYESRKRLASEHGMLLPIIRFRNNVSLEKNKYRILIYSKIAFEGAADLEDVSFYNGLIGSVENYCREHYSDLLNKSIVKVMIDNLKSQYPGVADDLIHIVEELELELRR